MEVEDFQIQGVEIETWHFTIELSVFALVWLRVAALLIWKPPVASEGSRAARLAARLTHLALYAFMIGMPLAGLLAAGEEGDTVRFFGLVIPPLFAGNEFIGELGEELHEVGATVGYALNGLHAAAALFHHLVLKDEVLKTMIPGCSK